MSYQIQIKETRYPVVTSNDVKRQSRFSEIQQRYDMLRAKYDIRNKGSHELTYYQKAQAEALRKYEAELRTYIK